MGRDRIKTSPRSRKPRRGAKAAAAKHTFNPPATRDGPPPGPQQEMADEDRSGRFIGRFGGAGEPPLPRMP